MSGDLTRVIVDASSVIQDFFLLLGLARVLQVRRGFVDPAYRSRALWTGLLMAVGAVTPLVTIFTGLGGSEGNLFIAVPFFTLLGVVFAFADRTILVAIKTDFFHRDILKWTKIRVPALLALVTSLGVGIGVEVAFPAFAEPNLPLWVSVGLTQALLVTGALLALGAVAMRIGSGRTPDMTLRKNIRLLGLALGVFVVGILGHAAIGIVNVELSQLFGQPFEVVATYLLYLSAKSLTPLGRVEKPAEPRQPKNQANQGIRIG